MICLDYSPVQFHVELKSLNQNLLFFDRRGQSNCCLDWDPVLFRMVLSSSSHWSRHTQTYTVKHHKTTQYPLLYSSSYHYCSISLHFGHCDFLFNAIHLSFSTQTHGTQTSTQLPSSWLCLCVVIRYNTITSCLKAKFHTCSKWKEIHSITWLVVDLPAWDPSSLIATRDQLYILDVINFISVTCDVPGIQCLNHTSCSIPVASHHISKSLNRCTN